LANEQIGSEYPPEDVLVKSLFHRALVFFHIPSTWRAGRVALTLLLPLAAVGSIWGLTCARVAVGLAAAGLLALFFLADALLLSRLPVWGVSYGPWQSQLFVLAIPRTLMALLLGVAPLIIAPPWALATLAGLQLLGSLALAYGTLIEPFQLELTHLTVKTEGLPESAPPIRILHISDLHVERLTRRESKLLRLIDEASPDLILISGDYLNLSYTRDLTAHAQVSQLLSQISAPHGVYAVLGSPPVDERDVVPALFEELPIRLLVNESALISLDNQRRLVILGLECSHHLPTDAAALSRLASTVPDHQPRVLLYHAPDLMPEAAGHDIDLYLCGHTHGGQVRLPFFGAMLTSSQLGKRYEMGLYRQGRTHMYVSRGVGLEGLSAPRIRFMARPEIALITLQGAKA
jgi:predicted MPP superfamily phosphohydrolase